MPTRTPAPGRLRPYKGKPLRVPVPLTPDPFINTPLISVGPGDDGRERFWISTYNANVGPLAALITEDGDARIYRFPNRGDWSRGGFYSAAVEDPNTLWLCGNIRRVVRLDLRTGKHEEYETGAPPALMFQGMVLDHDTGKLFAIAFPPPKTIGFSFDIRKRKTVKIHELPGPDHYMRTSWRNDDGTWSCVLVVPGETLATWDPRRETVETWQHTPRIDANHSTFRVITDDVGRKFLPGRGWLNPATKAFEPGPAPERHMTWFARRGTQAWGMSDEAGEARVGVWDMTPSAPGRGGQVRDLCRPPRAQLHNINLSASGKLVYVSVYGEFCRYDGQTGALEVSKRLDTLSHGHVDCIQRVDRERLIGTPFITQRFFEVNLRTGRGQDLGAAAPGFGEILKTWRLGGKVFMAAYTGGELMEFDPNKPARFPENPRVVADPPGGMRPVAAADDGRRIFYACSREYGRLGSVLAAYDTETGIARYAADPLPDQQVFTMGYDKPTHSLIVGTTIHADCQSCPPTAAAACVARIDADSFEVKHRVDALNGIEQMEVIGPLGKGKWLCTINQKFGQSAPGPWFALDPVSLEIPALADAMPWPEGMFRAFPAGKPGLFVLQFPKAVELWDMNRHRRLRAYSPIKDAHLHTVQDGSFYFTKQREIIVVDDALKGL